MSASRAPAVWFPTVRTGTGTDVSTKRLAHELGKRGIRAEITWLPLRAEYAPWTVPVPKPPAWTTIVHVNTWLHPRFLPGDLPVVVSLRHSTHRPELEQFKGLPRRIYHRYWMRPFERRVLERADIIVAVSRFAADTGQRALVNRPMEVIYNGVDTKYFRPGVRQRQRGEPFRLLYVGKWGLLKGVDLLAPIMRKLGDGFELRYTGGRAAKYDQQTMPLQANNIGRLDGEGAVIAAMQDADAFLFPSRSEGLPLAGIEAMACGLPIIGSRGTSLTEVVDDGITGILCPQDDVAAFVMAVRRVAGDPLLHANLSRASRARVNELFSMNRMIEDYIRVYGGMLT